MHGQLIFVDEIAQGNQHNSCSYHMAPSFRLSRYVDPQVTSQVRVGILAFKIGLAGINVSFVPIVKVILIFLSDHFVTSFDLCVLVGLASVFPTKRYCMDGFGQCGQVDWVVVGGNYHIVTIHI